MTPLVRHHTRWCLLFTGACLVVAFSLQETIAQRIRPGGISGRTGGFSGRTGGVSGISGRTGGFSGISGGVSGISGGFTGRTGGVIGNPGGFSGMPGGFTGLNPGFPENRVPWSCPRCGKGGTGNFALTFCPECGAPLNGGAGGFAPPVNPGFTPAPPVNVPPNAWQPAQPTTPTTASSPSSKASDEKSGGLSTGAVIGIGVVALSLFALIGGVIVALSGGGSSSQKPRRRKSLD